MLKVINPATEDTITELVDASRSDVTATFAHAKECAPAWANTPYAERAAYVARFRSLLAENITPCSESLSDEMGKPLSQARGEITATLGRIDWFLEHTGPYLAAQQVHRAPPMVEELSMEPLGVVGNISAWNFPYFVGTNVIIPALLTGNTLLYKPSEITSLTGAHIARLWRESGLPEGVFHCLIGDARVGSYLLEQNLNGMFFTGSYATGKKIAEQLAPRFIPSCFELGGKDPAYVCQDVNLAEAAASLADGAFYNAGQSCCAVERIYVHASHYDAFVEQFAGVVRGFSVGNPRDPATYMGPLSRPQQRAVLDAQVADALAKGGRLVVAGGSQATTRGYYYHPVVIADASADMTLMREESFGPVIGIQKVRDDEEALALMNDTDYGLTAAIYSRSSEQARTLGRQLNTGTVYWNCCDRVSPHLPWSGRQRSGLGSTLSPLGIKAFLRPKAWHLRSCND